MHKRILFYSSVSDLSFFNTQKFYQIDINILKDLGFTVETTNKKCDFFNKEYGGKRSPGCKIDFEVEKQTID